MTKPTHKKIIIFNGPPGSGKDTAANAVLKAIGKGYAQHEKMSEPLKKGVHALFGLSYNWNYYDDPDAAPEKDIPLVVLLGQSPRQAYISMSEDYLKPKFGKDVFGQLMLSHIKRVSYATVHIFSDGGFVDEWLPIIDYVSPASTLCVEVHANRDGRRLDFTGDSRSYIGDDLTRARPGVIVRKLYNDIGTMEDRRMFCHLAASMAANFLQLEIQ